MVDQNSLSIYLLIERCAKEAGQQLAIAVQQSNLSGKCYAHRIRIKCLERFQEKVDAKKLDKPYSPLSVTDVVGLRVVTLLKNDTLDALKHILNMVAHELELRPNPFEKDWLEEAIIYAVNPNQDVLAQSQKDIIIKSGLLKKSGKNVEIKESDSGYSSTHLIVRFLLTPEHIEKVCEESSLKNIHQNRIESYTIPCEIQIRTVYEDAWAEIDHRFGYEHRRTNKQTSSFTNNHLQVLKNFSDACSSYASNIAEEANGNMFSLGPTAEIKPAERDEAAIQVLTNAGISGAILEHFAAARRMMKDSRNPKGHRYRDERNRKFKETAETFANLLDQNADFINSRQAGGLKLKYLLSMDRALCILSTGEKNALYEAKQIYEDLGEDFPNDPTRWFRLGQCYQKLGKRDAAATALRKCEQMYKSAMNLRMEEQSQPEVGVGSDLEYLSVYLPKVLGLEFWLTSKSKLDDKNNMPRLKDLKQAYDCTIVGLDAIDRNQFFSEEEKADELIDLHNNLLFYSCVFYQGAVESGIENPDLDRFIIEKHTKYIEENADIENSDDVVMLDSVALAYVVLKRYEDACKLAKKVVKLIFERDYSNLSEDLYAALKRAQHTIQDHCS